MISLIIWTNLKLVYLCVAERQNTYIHRKVGRVPQKFVSQNSARNYTFLMWVLISTVLPPKFMSFGTYFHYLNIRHGNFIIHILNRK